MEQPLPVIQKHFLNPQNVGDLGTGSFPGRAGSLTCGAVVRVSLNIDESRRIIDAKFKAAGCSFLVAAASYLTQEIKGELSGEVASLLQEPEEAIAQALGPIPVEKNHCAAVFCQALLSAITAFSDSVRHEWHGEEALICTCFCVSESTIEEAIRTGGLRTISEVTRACNAGGGCRSCYSLIEDMLASSEVQR
jgi:NifU-like protein